MARLKGTNNMTEQMIKERLDEDLTMVENSWDMENQIHVDRVMSEIEELIERFYIEFGIEVEIC
jgi:DNA primase large subunit